MDLVGVYILSSPTQNISPHAGTEHLNACLQMATIATKLICGALAVFSMKSQGTVFSSSLLIQKIKGKQLKQGAHGIDNLIFASTVLGKFSA